MNRREALKVVAGLIPGIGIAALVGENVKSTNEFAVKGYFLTKTCVGSDGKIRRFYSKPKELPIQDIVLLDEGTFKPYRPFTSIMGESRIVLVDDKYIGWQSDVATPNQHVLCYNLEDPKETKWIVT